MHIFTINPNQDSLWRVRVVVHDTRKAMHEAKIKLTDDKSQEFAWCNRYSYRKAVEDRDGVFCEIHLCKGAETMKLAYIAHEVAHAVVAYFLLTRLKFEDSSDTIEEHAADTVEHLIDGIVTHLRDNGHRIR